MAGIWRGWWYTERERGGRGAGQALTEASCGLLEPFHAIRLHTGTKLLALG